MTTWIVLGALAVVGAFFAWVLRSFRRWPPTPDEQRFVFFGRRGGGDL